MSRNAHRRRRFAGHDMGGIRRAGWTTCDHCGKRSFRSRKLAKQFGRTAHPGDTNLSAYQCRRGGTGYHYGHLPEEVVQGEKGREDLEPVRYDDEQEAC